MANYPIPPSGKLSGADGAILRQGSAGRLGWNPYANDNQADAVGMERHNDHDGCYFTGSAFGEDDDD